MNRKKTPAATGTSISPGSDDLSSDCIRPRHERLADARRFFEIRHGTDAPGYSPIWLKFSDRSNSTLWFPAHDLDGLAEATVDHAERADVYVGMGLYDKPLGAARRGSSEDVVAIPGLWAEIDIRGDVHVGDEYPPSAEAALAEIVDRYPLKHTVLVNSGNGLHVHWLFKEIWVLDREGERAEAQQLLRGFHATLAANAHEHGRTIDNVSDLARVTRVPGTVNHKMPRREVRFLRPSPEAPEGSIDGPRAEPSEFEPYLVQSSSDHAESRVGSSAASIPPVIPSGQRHSVLLSVAGTLRRRGLSANAIDAALQIVNSEHCRPVAPVEDVRAIADEVASRYEPGAPFWRASESSRDDGTFFANSHSSPYPWRAFPEPFRSLIKSASAVLGVAPEMIGLPLLAFAGGTLGRGVCLVLRRDFVEFSILWTAVIAPPGTAKSPALAVARRPVDALQGEAHLRFMRECEAFKIAVARAKADGVDPGDPPHLEHFWSSDATPEALGPILESSPGVTLAQDELAGWVRSFDQYRRGGERQAHLAAWAGQPFKIDRASRDPIYVSHPVICVTGGIQPDMIGELTDDAARRDGFVERFLFAAPENSPSRWSDEEIPANLFDDAVSVFRRFRTSADDPVKLRLDAAAKSRWKPWYNRQMQRARLRGGLIGGIQAKLPRQVARLTIVLHCMAHDPAVVREVSSQTLRRAMALAEFHLEHAQEVLKPLIGSAMASERRLPPRVLRVLEREYSWMSTTDIHGALSRHIAASNLTAALDELHSAGLIDRELSS